MIENAPNIAGAVGKNPWAFGVAGTGFVVSQLSQQQIGIGKAVIGTYRGEPEATADVTLLTTVIAGPGMLRGFGKTTGLSNIELVGENRITIGDMATSAKNILGPKAPEYVEIGGTPYLARDIAISAPLGRIPVKAPILKTDFQPKGEYLGVVAPKNAIIEPSYERSEERV